MSPLVNKGTFAEIVLQCAQTDSVLSNSLTTVVLACSSFSVSELVKLTAVTEGLPRGWLVGANRTHFTRS